MIAALVALALVAAGLGVTAAALGIRIAGLREELGVALRRVDALTVAGQDHERAAAQAADELREAQARHLQLEKRRRTELEHLEEVAARCADPAEVRRQLQRLTTPGRRLP